MISKPWYAIALTKIEFVYTIYKLIHPPQKKKNKQNFHDLSARAKIGKAKVKSQQVPEKTAERKRKKNKQNTCYLLRTEEITGLEGSWLEKIGLISVKMRFLVICNYKVCKKDFKMKSEFNPSSCLRGCSTRWLNVLMWETYRVLLTIKCLGEKLSKKCKNIQNKMAVTEDIWKDSAF